MSLHISLTCFAFRESSKILLLKQLSRLPPSKFCTVQRSSSTAATSTIANAPTPTSPITSSWALSSAVVVERIPTLVPELSDLQSRMLEMLQQVEFEQSKKCEHELRHEEDEMRAAMKKSGEISAKDGPLTTAADDEDVWKKDFAAFKPASRKTKADETNDVKSTDRCLDRSLYLVVERKIGEVFHWDLPTTIRQEGETLRRTAERAILEHCGQKLEVRVLGNAPWAVYKYKYPKKIQEQTGKTGEKIFLYKAFYTSGTMQVQENLIRDFRWVLQDDLWELLDKRTRKSLSNILYDDKP